jgi:hypothetical protein
VRHDSVVSGFSRTVRDACEDSANQCGTADHSRVTCAATASHWPLRRAQMSV